jgi:uncharacterized membrane protein
MAGSQTSEKGAGTYAREALSEWGKAARYGARAIAAKRRERSDERPPLKERLNPATTDKGGRLGDVADVVLSKLGTPGKLASKASVGSRIVERMRDRKDAVGSPSEADEAQTPKAEAREQPSQADANGFGDGGPVPIQESLDVAVPLRAAYALCTRFEEYPEFLDRVAEVDEIDDTHVSFVAKVRGRPRELDVEIIDTRPNERLDWECAGEVEHSGVISFHRLAPRLTRMELTVELQPEGLLERVSRATHLTERAIRDELHRFKAYAELWEEDDFDEEVEEEEDFDDEELEDEAELEDEDEEDLEDEEGYDDDEEDFDDDELEPEEEEELEPAGSGR